MQWFKFTPGSSDTLLENGQPIHGADSKMWIERYREPGEFEILAPLSSGLREFLPTETLISHADTFEIGIVENHEIEEGARVDPTIKITGRMFESYLENRVVGLDEAKANPINSEIILSSDYPSTQVQQLVNGYVSTVIDPNDQLTNVLCTDYALSGLVEARPVKRGSLWNAVEELLETADLGIKSVRRNPWSPLAGVNLATTLAVHKGQDRTASVIFSWIRDGIQSASSLETSKGFKNSVMVSGRYVSVYLNGAESKYRRKWLYVDGSDIDGHLSEAPSGITLTQIMATMKARGRAALGGQRKVYILRADVAPGKQYQYRRDYDIGDLVSVNTNKGPHQIMRVVEHVEIEDKEGARSYPTLAIPGEAI